METPDFGPSVPTSLKRAVPPRDIDDREISLVVARQLDRGKVSIVW